MSKLFGLFQKYEKKQICHDNGGTVTIRSKEWVEKGAAEYENVFKRPQADCIKTNISEKKMYSRISQEKDWFLELQLRSDKYTFNNMLAVTDPYGEAPLTALVLFTTMMDYRVRAAVEGDTEDTGFVFEYPAAKRHRIPLLGLYPGRDTQIVIELLDENGESCDRRSFAVETEPLPEELQDVVRVKKASTSPEFPYVLAAGGRDVPPFMFDREGNIRYYLAKKPNRYGIFPLSQGRFLFMEETICTPSCDEPYSVQMYDMDYLGRAGRTYLVRNGAHHAACEKAREGSLIMAASSLDGRCGDMILEIDRQSGESVRTLRVGKLFDGINQDAENRADINSLFYDGERDDVIVSMGRLHSVADIDWQTGRIKWMLADPKLWRGTPEGENLLEPTGDVPWFYGQSFVAPVRMKENSDADARYIMVCGNRRDEQRKGDFSDRNTKSSINLYQINEKEKTVRFCKKFPCPDDAECLHAAFDPERRRLYAVSGYAGAPERKGKSVIWEYDFDSEEIVGEYEAGAAFYHAYRFCSDVGFLSKALLKNSDYVVGDLKRPEMLTDEEAEHIDFRAAGAPAEAAARYEIQEDILYISGRDHAVSRIYLQGKESVWRAELTNTCQTVPDMAAEEYSAAIWLDTLPADTYELYIQLGDELQDTGKKITKQK